MLQAKRLYLLDLLRGLASLSVVLWHYQHFFYVAPFTLSPDFSRSQQPFYSVLAPFYNEGSRAVDLFFVLSGFIFFFQYAESIRTRGIDLKKFALLRFSRLYPLHAVTLIAVAIGQTLYQRKTGHLFVYGCNDWKRFILSATFTTDWLPSGRICLAFNGPAWSISVEVFLYIVFFAMATNLPKRWQWQLFLTASMIGIGIFFFETDGFYLFGEPLFCFFAGGFCCLVWQRASTTRKLKWMAGSCLAVLVAASAYSYLFGLHVEVLSLIAFPSAVLALASAQNLSHNAGRSLRLIGDITYSTYLFHFPLQLFIALTVAFGTVALEFTSNAVWIGFFAILISLSASSYYLFERPMQILIRRVATYTPARLSNYDDAIDDLRTDATR